MEPQANVLLVDQRHAISGTTRTPSILPAKGSSKKANIFPTASRAADGADFPKVSNISERWNDQIMLHARVYDVSEQTVSCDCVVDEETQLIEKRTFPRLIFDTLPDLQEGSLTIVDIKQKAGSIRIDIKNGKGIVDPRKFELESLIDSLKDF